MRLDRRAHAPLDPAWAWRFQRARLWRVALTSNDMETLCFGNGIEEQRRLGDTPFRWTVSYLLIGLGLSCFPSWSSSIPPCTRVTSRRALSEPHSGATSGWPASRCTTCASTGIPRIVFGLPCAPVMATCWPCRNVTEDIVYSAATRASTCWTVPVPARIPSHSGHSCS